MWRIVLLHFSFFFFCCIFKLVNFVEVGNLAVIYSYSLSSKTDRSQTGSVSSFFPPFWFPLKGKLAPVAARAPYRSSHGSPPSPHDFLSSTLIRAEPGHGSQRPLLALSRTRQTRIL